MTTSLLTNHTPVSAVEPDIASPSALRPMPGVRCTHGILIDDCETCDVPDLTDQLSVVRAQLFG